MDTREVQAQIVVTWFKDGTLEASWPSGEGAEIMTRYMLSKAEDAYNLLVRQQAMIESMKDQPRVLPYNGLPKGRG